MLYLATFLSLLVSLLIVLMDPVSHRQSLDTYEGEAYVVGFLNQHQAAKDYLYYWLGMVAPGSSVNGVSVPGIEAFASNVNVQYVGQASAIALPGGQLEEFLPNGLVSELHYNEDSNTSYLSFQDRTELSGSYHSALICLDGNNLAPCYRYLCEGGCPAGGEVVDDSFCASCATADEIRQISFREDVRPYVITYSDTLEPAWWQEKGEPKAIRKQLWRRAMTRRTHASHNCGVLFRAPLDETNNPKYHWINANVGMINKIQPDESKGQQSEVYCIDNGNRCMKLLPHSIQGFLEQMVNNTETQVQGQNDLQDVFFCISEVKNNPYESIAPATYHFDGINSAARGAPFMLSTAQWPSLTNKVLNGSIYLPPNADIVAIDGQPTLTNPITMPFQQNPANNFTLIFVTEGNLNNGNILNDSSAPYALYVDEGELTFSYRDADSLYTVPLSDETSIKKYIWQLVKEGTTLTLYLNGQPIQTVVGSLLESTANVTFGPSNNVKLLNVRYYDNRVLTKNQLNRMLDIDTKRFGRDTVPIAAE